MGSVTTERVSPRRPSCPARLPGPTGPHRVGLERARSRERSAGKGSAGPNAGGLRRRGERTSTEGDRRYGTQRRSRGTSDPPGRARRTDRAAPARVSPRIGPRSALACGGWLRILARQSRIGAPSTRSRPIWHEKPPIPSSSPHLTGRPRGVLRRRRPPRLASPERPSADPLIVPTFPSLRHRNAASGSLVRPSTAIEPVGRRLDRVLCAASPNRAGPSLDARALRAMRTPPTSARCPFDCAVARVVLPIPIPRLLTRPPPTADRPDVGTRTAGPDSPRRGQTAGG